MPSWHNLILLIFLGFIHFGGMYQMLYLYEIAGWTTAKYIVFTFWKEAPHVEAVNQISMAIWVAVFVLMMLIYGPHLSFESVCTLNICKLFQITYQLSAI